MDLVVLVCTKFKQDVIWRQFAGRWGIDCSPDVGFETE